MTSAIADACHFTEITNYIMSCVISSVPSSRSRHIYTKGDNYSYGKTLSDLKLIGRCPARATRRQRTRLGVCWLDSTAIENAAEPIMSGFFFLLPELTIFNLLHDFVTPAMWGFHVSLCALHAATNHSGLFRDVKFPTSARP